MNIIKYKVTPTRHAYIGCVWWVCMMGACGFVWACLVGVALTGQ